MLEDWAPEFAAFTDVVDENVVVVVPPPCLDLGLNVPRQPLAPSTRFNVITSAEELATYSKGFVPQNTLANNEWAVRNFSEWAEWRCKSYPDHPIPENILTCADASTLNKWLSLYIIETRKRDGQRYPSSTLNLLLCGLKRYMKKINPSIPNFLDENDARFAGLRGARDCVARKLREDGVGASVKHAQVITHSEELQLWDAGVLGIHSPSTLLNTVFFMNGSVLCLRGGREHKQLKLSQFTFGLDEVGEFVVYEENGSKNRSGSYKEKADSNKIVKHYANPDIGNKCYISILKLYLSKLPPQLFEDSLSVFYYRKLDIPSDTTWFSSQPIGRNILASMIQTMFQKIGISGKSNHSLRATGATRLFEANVPEKLIQERTGHRSLGALRQYEHTSAARQQQYVSSIIASPLPMQQSIPTAIPQQCVQGTDVNREIVPALLKDCNLSNFTLNVNIKK